MNSLIYSVQHNIKCIVQYTVYNTICCEQYDTVHVQRKVFITYVHYTVLDHIHIFKFYWKIYCVQYNIQCTLQYTVHITIYSAHYNMQCTVKYTVYQYNIQCTQYTVLSTIYSVQFNMQCLLYYNIPCTVQSTVYSMIYSLQYNLQFTVQCAVYSIKYRTGNFWRLKHI